MITKQIDKTGQIKEVGLLMNGKGISDVAQYIIKAKLTPDDVAEFKQSAVESMARDVVSLYRYSLLSETLGEVYIFERGIPILGYVGLGGVTVPYRSELMEQTKRDMACKISKAASAFGITNEDLFAEFANKGTGKDNAKEAMSNLNLLLAIEKSETEPANEKLTRLMRTKEVSDVARYIRKANLPSDEVEQFKQKALESVAHDVRAICDYAVSEKENPFWLNVAYGMGMRIGVLLPESMVVQHAIKVLANNISNTVKAFGITRDEVVQELVNEGMLGPNAKEAVSPLHLPD